ncbi:unnamed protein product, partial [Anisakis simplex]|uniref:Uncharacterized protein n=1 Tax=Anisakis simplex TaxID=6269 RepID=A0A0M3KHD3_ANISI
MALWKICRHTQDEFIAKRSLSQANQLKAYEMSQKQLFSDDRETPDSSSWKKDTEGMNFSQKRKSSLNDGVGDSETAHMPMRFANLFRTKSEPLMSDHGSRCEHEEEDSDRLSVESALREPLKFRCPHAFVRFGVGGKVLIMDPSLSTSLIEVKDLKVAVKDSETKH